MSIVRAALRHAPGLVQLLWANLNNVSYIEDNTNTDTRHTRNYIRHEMMPNVLRVNPGIHKTIAKKVKDEYTA